MRVYDILQKMPLTQMVMIKFSSGAVVKGWVDTLLHYIGFYNTDIVSVISTQREEPDTIVLEVSRDELK